MAGTGVNLSPNCVIPGNSKEKVGKENPPDALIMENLETSLDTTVYKAGGNTVGSIVERFMKPSESTMLGHPIYLMDGPGPPISISGTHYESFDSAFGIWIGVKRFHMDDAYQSGCKMYGSP